VAGERTARDPGQHGQPAIGEFDRELPGSGGQRRAGRYTRLLQLLRESQPACELTTRLGGHCLATH